MVNATQLLRALVHTYTHTHTQQPLYQVRKTVVVADRAAQLLQVRGQLVQMFPVFATVSTVTPVQSAETEYEVKQNLR